jgi:hypothetical protein
MMRAIPTRTDPLTRATMPAITRHGSDDPQDGVKCCRRPSPRASRELRACRLHSSLATIDVGFVLYCQAGCHSSGDLAEVLDNLGVFPRRTSGSGRAVPSGFRG